MDPIRYLDLNKDLFKSYLEFRAHLKNKGYESIVFSYKDFSESFFLLKSKEEIEIEDILENG